MAPDSQFEESMTVKDMEEIAAQAIKSINLYPKYPFRQPAIAAINRLLEGVKTLHKGGSLKDIPLTKHATTDKSPESTEDADEPEAAQVSVEEFFAK